MSAQHDSKIYKEELLDLLRRVDITFRKQGIKYFAVYGTCLGAVREGGIIPWDDDVDIAVWRDDFCRALQALNDSDLQIFAGDRHTVPGCPSRCGRIFNRIKAETGIERKRAYLDLHIIDYAPKSKLHFLWDVLWYVGVIRILERRNRVSSNAHAWLYAVADVMALPFRVCSSRILNKLADWIYCYRRRTPFVKITFDGNRKRYRSADFSDAKNFSFGGMDISVPIGYENYLTKCYGDWRTPPSLDERKSHAFDSTGNAWTVQCPDENLRLEK